MPSTIILIIPSRLLTHSTSEGPSFSNSQRFTLSPTQLFQYEDWALRGKFQRRQFSVSRGKVQSATVISRPLSFCLYRPLVLCLVRNATTERPTTIPRAPFHGVRRLRRVFEIIDTCFPTLVQHRTSCRCVPCNDFTLSNNCHFVKDSKILYKIGRHTLQCGQ